MKLLASKFVITKEVVFVSAHKLTAIEALPVVKTPRLSTVTKGVEVPISILPSLASNEVTLIVNIFSIIGGPMSKVVRLQ